MNPLPPPNWNCSPNNNYTGNFPPFSNHGYGRLPFFGQQNSYQERFFAQRPPFEQPQSPIQRPHRPLPSPTQQDFSCDVCERSFKGKHILDGHLRSHVKCDVEGCSFSASRKMLKLHFIQNHAEGRMRIKLDTPEEIAKWREQRRKRYPTLANIEKKLADEQARRESGQIAKTQTFRYQGKRQKRHERKTRYQKTAKHQKPQTNSEIEKNPLTAKQNEAKKTVGDPLSMVLSDSNNSDNEGEKKSTPTPAMQLSSSASTSALASLCSYGRNSSSGESEDEKEVNNNNTQATKPITNKQMLSKRNEDKPSPHKRNLKRRKKGGDKNNVTVKKKVTLLEKLLAPEMRHEHNVILQCIRYIVNNDYFDVETMSTSTRNGEDAERQNCFS